jgi:hypothetical protein
MADSQKVVCPPDAFIRTTGQLWKLIVGGVVLPISVSLVGLWGFRQIGRGPLSDLLPSMGILVVGAIATVLVLASVSCPQCRRRLLGEVFSAPDGNAAITGFLARRTCPSCGYSPNQARSTAG